MQEQTGGGLCNIFLPLEIIMRIIECGKRNTRVLQTLACASTGTYSMVFPLLLKPSNPFQDFDLQVAKTQPSTKFDAMFYYIDNCIQPDEKAIIFCEW